VGNFKETGAIGISGNFSGVDSSVNGKKGI